MNFNYLLIDDGGASNCELPVLMAIGTKFRHEYGIYVVTDYLNDEGKIETRFTKITQVSCDRERTKKP